jgi:uncharacterized protein YndB with AHSA1/START domain
MATAIKDKKDLIITRVFDAPRELVWKAWTEPERVKEWWGPKVFAAPVIKIDLRVGGKYLYCMRDPDDKDYWSTGVYREIVPMQRIVYTDNFADEKGNRVPASHYGMSGDWPSELLVTVTFEQTGGKTKMTLQHVGLPWGQMSDLALIGWNESFDKLADTIVSSDRTKILAEPGKEEVIITREFDAPRNLVFKAYTDPNLIPQWWGPRRFTTVIDKMDVKQGGLWRFVQRSTAGNEYAFHGVIHEITSPERIVSTFEFEGMPGHISLDTVTLEESGGKTKFTTRSVFQTVEDRDGMIKSGMEEGVFETMDRLAELLEKLIAEKKAA